MPYNSLISRTDAAALIPLEVSSEIVQSVAQTNPIMTLAKRLPNMSTSQRRLPVMSALATAYFVDGDTSLKQTSEVAWENKYIDAEELAVIVPIPEAVLDDSSFDIWNEVKPSLVAAFNKAIAQAVMYGTNIPASWTTNIGSAGLIAGVAAAAQNVSLAAYTDMYEAILGENGAGAAGVFGMVEADGYMVTGSIAHTTMRGKLRNIRDVDGGLIFTTSMQGTNTYALDGQPVYFPLDGSVSATYYLLSGQWDQLVYSMRQDITYKVLDQAVIQDNAGTIVYNLAQQDMIALRAVMRLGFALPNPVNQMNAVSATRYPFAYLTA
jgi:HK97 family phage major capsid protein